MEDLKLPLLPLRGIMVFPGNLIHLDVGRERSLKAIEESMKTSEQFIVLATQKDLQVEEPSEKDLFNYGTLALVSQIIRLPGGALRVLTEGLRRVRIISFLKNKDFFQIVYEEIDEEAEDKKDLEILALKRTALDLFLEWSSLSEKITNDEHRMVAMITDTGIMADAIVAHLPLNMEEKYLFLKEASIKVRLENICVHLTKELDILRVEKKINERVKKQVEKTQKDFYLREQIKAINVELGDKEDKASEIEDYRQKLSKFKISDKAREKIEKEIKRLERMSSAFAEVSVIRNYLDCLLDLPWNDLSKEESDINKSEQVLEEDHYGLEKVKERILEYLAVRQLNPEGKGSILCLCGPPGVGKTSLARSVAKAMGRKFVRASLGGVRDEAEIRGHRRTYIGAMPGRIMQGMRDAKVKNPVFLLDEVDKMSVDFRGDPSSALLEVLDSEQNDTFSDHYVELPFDLSKVFWLVTANALYNIPRPLLDRMEVIEVSGYTEEEKIQIAKKHLLPKMLKEHGLKNTHFEWQEETILSLVIRGYTREAGVRGLERKIASLCRKVARQIVQKKKKIIKIEEKNLNLFLGIPRFSRNFELLKSQVGVAVGLAWTEAGGDILPVEVLCVNGKGGLLLTGQLGEVMQESAQAAFSYIRACADKLGIVKRLGTDFYEKYDLHVHIPEGAIPKDGPSAGITLVTAMSSALSGKLVSGDIAMTGEITLRGRVLPIGGLKEKILAAHRNGIKKIIIPKENKKDLEEVPLEVKKKVKIFLVEHMDEVLKKTLLKENNSLEKGQKIKDEN